MNDKDELIERMNTKRALNQEKAYLKERIEKLEEEIAFGRALEKALWLASLILFGGSTILTGVENLQLQLQQPPQSINQNK